MQTKGEGNNTNAHYSRQQGAPPHHRENASVSGGYITQH